MSEELKRKLSNYEESPPEIIWSRIVAALSEEISPSLSQKLYHAELDPPSALWNNISSALDTTAPGYVNKLYQLEEAPPASLWQGIAVALDGAIISKISPKRRIAPFFRYTIAAGIIGIVALGAYRFFSTGRKQPVAVVKATPQSSSHNQVPPANEDSSAESTTPDGNLPEDGAALATTGLTSHKRKSLQQPGYIAQAVVPAVATANTSLNCSFEEAVLHGDIPGDCSVISENDPYFMFMNPNGYLIRISKKLAQKLGCVYTNGNSDQYRQCESQIKKWSDKIAQSPSVPSLGNFMDILDIIRSDN